MFSGMENREIEMDPEWVGSVLAFNPDPQACIPVRCSLTSHNRFPVSGS